MSEAASYGPTGFFLMYPLFHSCYRYFPSCHSFCLFRHLCLANSFSSAISPLCHFMRCFRQLRLPNPFTHHSRAYVIIPSPLPYCAPCAIISRTFYHSPTYQWPCNLPWYSTVLCVSSYAFQYVLCPSLLTDTSCMFYHVLSLSPWISWQVVCIPVVLSHIPLLTAEISIWTM